MKNQDTATSTKLKAWGKSLVNTISSMVTSVSVRYLGNGDSTPSLTSATTMANGNSHERLFLNFAPDAPKTEPPTPAHAPQQQQQQKAEEKLLTLDEQLELEIIKLEMLRNDLDATNQQMNEQKHKVNQLRRLKEGATQQQQQQRYEHSEDTLEDRLGRFFAKYEPNALVDGRLERITIWGNLNGEFKLNQLLRNQYGGADLSETRKTIYVVDQAQVARIARRLAVFYRAHQVFDKDANELQKIAVWTCKSGEAALNAKLRKKYQGEDLDSFAHRVVAEIRDDLRAFYQAKNPAMLEERGIDTLLTWAVEHGVDALNTLLYNKYGEDLRGWKKHPDSFEV